jgi:hypothetical protein
MAARDTHTHTYTHTHRYTDDDYEIDQALPEKVRPVPCEDVDFGLISP